MATSGSSRRSGGWTGGGGNGRTVFVVTTGGASVSPPNLGHPESHSPGPPYGLPRAGHLRVFTKFLLCVAATRHVPFCPEPGTQWGFVPPRRVNGGSDDQRGRGASSSCHSKAGQTWDGAQTRVSSTGATEPQKVPQTGLLPKGRVEWMRRRRGAGALRKPADRGSG